MATRTNKIISIPKKKQVVINNDHVSQDFIPEKEVDEPVTVITEMNQNAIFDNIKNDQSSSNNEILDPNESFENQLKMLMTSAPTEPVQPEKPIVNISLPLQVSGYRTAIKKVKRGL